MDVACIESVRKSAIRIVGGRMGRSSIRGLKGLKVYGLDEPRFRGAMIETFKILGGLTE